VRSLVTLVALVAGSSLLAAEPTLVSEARKLELADIGKVFVKIDEEPHPNFGHYLVLTSVDSLYGFDTFNLDAGKPAGKLHISYSASPRFREVLLDRDTMNRTWAAIQRADEQNKSDMAKWRKTLPGGDPDLVPAKAITTALELGDVDFYARMIRRPNPQRLELQFQPALVADLLLAERRAGKPLTRLQVERIRDETLVGAVPSEYVTKLRVDRGYADLDPAKVWQEWQKVRVGLLR
jgi:hypothetical protein